MRVLFNIQGESSDRLKKDRDFYKNRKYFIDKYINRDESFYIFGGMSGKNNERRIYQDSFFKRLISIFF